MFSPTNASPVRPGGRTGGSKERQTMRPDIHQPTTHTVFPPPPIVRSAEPRRPRVRPHSIAVVAAWAIVAVLLVQQRHEIELLHQRATDTSRALDERFSSLTDSQAALETELEGVFDPSAVVRSALPSVFTLTAGPSRARRSCCRRMPLDRCSSRTTTSCGSRGRPASGEWSSAPKAVRSTAPSSAGSPGRRHRGRRGGRLTAVPRIGAFGDRCR